MTSLDPEYFAHNQGVSHNGPGFCKDPSKGLAGHIHESGRRLLTETLKIR
jgi:hypothetical protein